MNAIVKTACITVFLLLAARQAEASRDPPKPDSGVVIHLFGPKSVLSNVMPSMPGTAASSAGQPDSGYQEPGVSDILHQMFVTGDPNAKFTPPAGRSADR